MSEIAILVPTLGRADALAPLFDSVRATTPDDAYRLVFVADHADEPTHRAILALPHCPQVDLAVSDGTYPQKINAGYRACDERLILPTADDVVFHSGWLEAALDAFGSAIEVVGTNDLTPATAKGKHATMPIVTRDYIEYGAVWGEPGILFHEGYHHNFVERELNELAKSRGVWTFAANSIIEHRHPSWGTAEVDDTYRRGAMSNWEHDSALFDGRSKRWT